MPSDRRNTSKTAGAAKKHYGDSTHEVVQATIDLATQEASVTLRELDSTSRQTTTVSKQSLGKDLVGKMLNWAKVGIKITTNDPSGCLSLLTWLLTVLQAHQTRHNESPATGSVTVSEMRGILARRPQGASGLWTIPWYPMEGTQVKASTW